MKKISMILGVAFLVLAAGCQKLGEGVTLDNTDAPQTEENQKVELFATLPLTRTTLSSDFMLEWNKNDQMAVFNAPTGTEEYSDNLNFVIDEEATGKFTPADEVTVPFEDGVNYDWFVCSPYRVLNGVPELVTPKGEAKEDGYFPIGAQTQTGYNSAEHIGGVDIMVGKATDTRTPDIALKHLAVLHKFTVTNRSDKPTVITKLTLNGGENKLFGTFWIDLTVDEPAIDINKANGSFNERALTINEGTELAVGESADFYMMTAPFTLSAGETFKVTIETSTGSQTVSKTTDEDIVFAAGTYNTASLVYDYLTPDYLYYETFYDCTNTLPTTGTASTNFNSMDVRWKNYLKDLSGLSVYDGVITDITYAWTNSQPSAQESTVLEGMDGNHLWFGNVNSTFTVSGIKLQGKTMLNLSFLQTYNYSGLKLEYSLNDGADWTEIDTVTNPDSAACQNRSLDFEVASGSQTIDLRFTCTVKGPRIDNIKLTWQAE